MRIRWLAGVAVALFLGGPAQAQPAKALEPTAEVRVRSVNDLLDKAEYVGGLAGKDDVVKAVRMILKNLSAEGKGIEGIDPKRPFGLYATLSADVINSPVIAMVPIASQERFLQMLKDRLEIVPEKAEGGTLKAFVPVVNELYLRFTNDYLYVARTPKELDPKLLITPKAFFARDDGAVGSLIVRMDRIPAEVKTFVIGQFELAAAEQRKKNGANESPAEKAILDWLGDGLAGGLKTLLEDSKELNVRIFIDEKADELSAELTLTAKSGSTLSKTLSSLAGKTSLPAAIVSVKDPAVRGSAKAALTPDLKKRLAGVVDAAIADVVKKADPNAKDVVRKILETLAPTVKAAELDAAVALGAADARGRHVLILAAGVKEGKEIEKLLKELAGFAGGVADFDFDVEKSGAFAIHKITLNDFPPELHKIFGTKTIWLAISENHIVLSVEADGNVIRAGLKAKPVTVPAFTLELSAAKIVPLIAQDVKPDELKALMKDSFGDGSPMGKDTLTVTITGGEQLTAKAKVKGKAVRLVLGLEQFKIK